MPDPRNPVESTPAIESGTPIESAPPGNSTSPDAPTAEADPELTKTGTTIVALAAQEGAVVMADKRASAGGRFVTSKDTQKVEEVHPTAAIALSGAVGSLQAYTRHLRSHADQYAIERGDPPSMNALATFAGNLLRGGQFPRVQTLLAGVDGDGPRVYDMDGGGSVLEAPYAAKGSGTQFALGVLEREYRDGLPMAEATSVAARAVASAIERDTASGNGVTVAHVTRDGVTIDVHDDPAALYENGVAPGTTADSEEVA